MEYDLKILYIVRGKIIMAMSDLRRTGDDPEMLQILRNAQLIFEKRIFDAELPNKIDQYKNYLYNKWSDYELSAIDRRNEKI